tara:strand:+ start:439 stop:915 length:477 start_codon:yes stop_codon:yes gene_type:complete
MKIQIKFNIDFGKAILKLEEKNFNETLNLHLSTNLADTLKKFIKTPNNGLKELSPTQMSVRQFKYNVTRKNPLWMTGNLLNSLKGSNKGLKGVSYINKGEENHADGYTWKSSHPDKMTQNPKVPARNIMIAYTENERNKNNEEFGEKIVKLINKTIRK